ncbi:histidine kinase/DNA gyrase B/HSP90-like ATPase [Kribbella orskensis]|uniref:histidine kinase n=1 Tax=Kribbella orskensis TaxID=2512216 RepID=A0ABY2BFH7_9ACTN|nr:MULTISPECIES: sensor histidine kinase [Kribbella]TCN37661.1 histidine kinase/DNA gyrase B/HSP90-like ATPase [Kribbella sp. VKM Ac-2500]TCO18837.1 histidine kinase/DNA gyrase B/HSP90-like ATPase [Kribbella orskensis]
MGVASTQRGGEVPRAPESWDGLRSLRGVCHDVGQELAVVQALARLAALEAGLPEQVRRQLETIGEHAAYVARMMSDSVEGITDSAEFDLSELVSRMVADIRLRTQATCRVVASPVRVVANPILLRRAVVNLLDNAVRAAGPDGLVLARVLRDGDNAVVEIEDDGPGWGQVGPGLASLGLGVAHNCVAEHGGDLELETGQLGGALVRLRVAAGVS